MDGQTDGGNDITPSAEMPRGKNGNIGTVRQQARKLMNRKRQKSGNGNGYILEVYKNIRPRKDTQNPNPGQTVHIKVFNKMCKAIALSNENCTR